MPRYCRCARCDAVCGLHVAYGATRTAVLTYPMMLWKRLCCTCSRRTARTVGASNRCWRSSTATLPPSSSQGTSTVAFLISHAGLPSLLSVCAMACSGTAGTYWYYCMLPYSEKGMLLPGAKPRPIPLPGEPRYCAMLVVRDARDSLNVLRDSRLFFHLCKYPEWQEKCRNEVLTVLNGRHWSVHLRPRSMLHLLLVRCQVPVGT